MCVLGVCVWGEGHRDRRKKGHCSMVCTDKNISKKLWVFTI